MKSLIQLAARTSVQPQWVGRFGRRDEPFRTGTSGESWWQNGVDGRLSVGAVYAVVVGLVVAWTIVTIFSTARDISCRLGSPQNLWEPVLWNVTSAIIGIAVLPLARRGALLFRGPIRLWTAAAGFVAFALAYSALHIAGMGILRELAYAAGGWNYSFPWSRQIPYELRKDLFSYLAVAVIFWFAERPAGAAPAHANETAEKAVPPKPELWLRDGCTSVLIDAGEIGDVGRQLCGI